MFECACSPPDVSSTLSNLDFVCHALLQQEKMTQMKISTCTVEVSYDENLNNVRKNQLRGPQKFEST